MAGTAVPVWVFANNPNTTVATNGYASGSATGDAPAALTSETWTMTSSASFPAASSSATPPAQFAIADAAAPSEIIWVTNMSGVTWTLTRGAEGTTPVTHAAGATFYQAITNACLGGLNPADGDFYGNLVSAPAWPLYGSQLYAVGGSMKSVNADGLAYEIGQQVLQGSAVAATSSSSPQNITGLSAALGVGKYFIDIRTTWVATTTVGSTHSYGFSTSSPPTLTAMNMTSWISSNSTTAADSATSVNYTSTTLSDTMWTSPIHTGTTLDGFNMAMFWGTITVSVAGTLQFCFLNTMAADEITVPAGSLMIIRPNNLLRGRRGRDYHRDPNW